MNRSNINTGHGVRKAARFTRRSRKRPMSTSKTTVSHAITQMSLSLWTLIHAYSLRFGTISTSHFTRLTWWSPFITIIEWNNWKEVSLTFVVSFRHCRFVVEAQKVKGWHGNSWTLGDLRMVHSFLWQVDKARAWVTVQRFFSCVDKEGQLTLTLKKTTTKRDPQFTAQKTLYTY